MFTATADLPAAPPFDFGPSLRFVRGFPPTSGEQEVGGGALTEALRARGRTVVARVVQAGGGVRATLHAADPIGPDVLRTGPYDEVKGFLLGLPGVGPWSTNFVLIRGLGRMDEAPVEKALLRAASRAYGRALTEARVRELAERYGPWQGYWAHYLRAGA
ncbi:hypothetical protein [Actinomadura chokoriensis]|uniref:hypothetical protein n=1 Tax=Actinomadura chokoriensis TaxID=454156 RepID=UPI0031F7AC1D